MGLCNMANINHTGGNAIEKEDKQNNNATTKYLNPPALTAEADLAIK